MLSYSRIVLWEEGSKPDGPSCPLTGRNDYRLVCLENGDGGSTIRGGRGYFSRFMLGVLYSPNLYGLHNPPLPKSCGCLLDFGTFPVDVTVSLLDMYCKTALLVSPPTADNAHSVSMTSRILCPSDVHHLVDFARDLVHSSLLLPPCRVHVLTSIMQFLLHWF